MTTVVDFLRQVPLFAALNDAQLADIERIVFTRRFACGDLILRQGEPGDALYLIHDGRVRIFVAGVGDEETMLRAFGPGEFFGELAMLDGRPRRASVQALEDCTTLVLERDDMLRLLRQHPLMCLALCVVLADRVRRTDDLLEEALTRVVGGFVPVCAWCKRIRAEEGKWHSLETYIPLHTRAQVSHGICPDCDARLSETLRPGGSASG